MWDDVYITQSARAKSVRSDKKDAKSWLKQLKRYFIAAGLNEADAGHDSSMNAVA